MFQRAGKVTVDDDLGVIRFLIDLSNFLKLEEDRIDNTDKKFFEAMVMAFRQLGTINSTACDDFIREYLNKPTLSRRSFRNYRTILAEKKWLKKIDRQYEIGIEALKLHNKKFVPEFKASYEIILEKVGNAVGTGD